jgi:hypothetical protein
MFKAIVFIFGAAAYLVATQAGYDAATAGTLGINGLYTHASAVAADISAANR